MFRKPAKTAFHDYSPLQWSFHRFWSFHLFSSFHCYQLIFPSFEVSIEARLFPSPKKKIRIWSKRNSWASGLETSSPKWFINCICFCCQSFQQSPQTSSPILAPNSFGSGANPSFSPELPQRAHLNLSPKIPIGEILPHHGKQPPIWVYSRPCFFLCKCYPKV